MVILDLADGNPWGVTMIHLIVNAQVVVVVVVVARTRLPVPFHNAKDGLDAAGSHKEATTIHLTVNAQVVVAAAVARTRLPNK